MDRLNYYRHCIQTLLQNHSQTLPSQDEIETVLSFDTLNDHYQLMRIGWQDMKRIYHTVLHFDIKDSKIWLQQNTTDIDVGQELIEMEIPKEDIILGIHPAYKRIYTGYGVA